MSNTPNTPNTPNNTAALWLMAGLIIIGAGIGSLIPQFLNQTAEAVQTGTKWGLGIGAVAALGVFIYGKLTK